LKAFRQYVERLFEKLGRLIYRNRVKALLLTGLFTLPMIVQLQGLVVDTSNESFFHKDDGALLDYNSFRDQFGKDELFIIALDPPEVFDLKFLGKLKALHEDLEENVPYVDEITSLVNARHTRGEGDLLVVEDLLEDWPETEARLAEIRERALANPHYVNNLISGDGSFTAVVLKAQTYVGGEYEDVISGFDGAVEDPAAGEPGRGDYLSNEQNIEILDAVNSVLEKYEAPDFPVHLAGTPVVVAALDRGIQRTMRTLTPLSMLLIVVLLLVMFRRLSGVLYPVVIVTVSMLSTFGVMAALGLPVTHITQILPTFLIVVGVGDSVHILAVFYLRFDRTGDREGAVVYALGHSGLAVLMTSLTTAAGLFSFVAADVAPISDLGAVAPVGVLLAFAYTVVLLPALIALFPLKRKMRKGAEGDSPMGRLLSGMAGVSCGHPFKIILVSFAILVLSVAGTMKIRFSHNALKWFPEDHAVRKATALIDERLKGTVLLEVVVDTGEENGLHEPEVLERLDGSVEYVEGLRVEDVFVGKAWTLTTVLKEINRALNEDRPEFYSVPGERKLVAQEFLLFESSGSDDLEEVVDTEFRKARFTLRAPFRDAVKYKRLLDSVSEHFRGRYPDEEIKVTGVMALFIAMINNAISTMAKSYAIALSIITVLMMLLIGRVRIGMLSMVPNLIPILMILGLMGWADIPMDLSNILVGSVAIGLVVDDTIHFMHNFRRYFEESGDVREAVTRTLQTTGRAILVTSVVLSGGFFICMLAEMKNTYYYGLLTGSAVVLALVADFFLAPALMAAVHGRRAPDRETTGGAGR
jgi:predicted RND superfamily exporter protein